jgi:hypothetical protein
VNAALRALLDHLIDYAGLFPPAQLPMTDAVARYAAYRRSPAAWMLGRFVVPAARLGEFAAAAEPLLVTGGDPWRLSVLVSDDAAADFAAIAALNASHRGAVCDAAEAKAGEVDQIAKLARVARDAPVATYVEIPIASDPAPLVAALGTQGMRAKVRTGGITPAAVPDAAHVIRFIAACIRAKVAFKATAGLHHPVCGSYPLTYEEDSAHARMFGFLNVFLAAAVLRDGAHEADALDLLSEHDAAAFTFADDGVRWRGHFILTPRVAQLRERAAVSFGSCSFDEPLADLQSIGVL